MGGGGFGGGGPTGGRLSFGVGVNSNSGVVGSVVMDGNKVNPNNSTDFESLIDVHQHQVTASWTQAGGLSLPIEIQREGNVLRFSRASGSPRLALTVRPNESDKMGLGFVWSAVWVAIAVWLLRLIAGASRGFPCRQMGGGLIVLGLLGMFFLPSPLSEACFVAFAIAAIMLSIGVLRRRRQNAAA